MMMLFCCSVFLVLIKRLVNRSCCRALMKCGSRIIMILWGFINIRWFLNSVSTNGLSVRLKGIEGVRALGVGVLW